MKRWNSILALAGLAQLVAASVTHAAETVPGPVVSADATAWSGCMVIIIIFMFIAAAVIGPIYRLCMPQEAPQPLDHDDHHDDHHDDGHGGHGAAAPAHH